MLLNYSICLLIFCLVIQTIVKIRTLTSVTELWICLFIPSLSVFDLPSLQLLFSFCCFGIYTFRIDLSSW